MLNEYLPIVKKVRDMAHDPMEQGDHSKELSDYLHNLDDKTLKIIQAFIYGHLLREASGLEYHNPFEDGDGDETSKVTETRKIADPDIVIQMVIDDLGKNWNKQDVEIDHILTKGSLKRDITSSLKFLGLE